MSRFEVWRLDDNGNRYLLSGHDDRAGAEARVAEMEAGVQHKQLYYVVDRHDRHDQQEQDPGSVSRH